MRPRVAAIFSHYEILEKLGEGGMGVVSLARDTRLGRLVALKQIRPEACCAGALKARFLDEARAASSLNYPNIITIYDIDTSAPGGGETIAMEYVKGRTLDAPIGRRPLPVAEALEHAVQIARALEAAHAAGIVHRDIEPANIMVSENSGLGKVLDFGLANSCGVTCPRPARPPPALSPAHSTTCRRSRPKAAMSTPAPICSPSAACSMKCSRAAAPLPVTACRRFSTRSCAANPRHSPPARRRTSNGLCAAAFAKIRAAAGNMWRTSAWRSKNCAMRPHSASPRRAVHRPLPPSRALPGRSLRLPPPFSPCSASPGGSNCATPGALPRPAAAAREPPPKRQSPASL
ncbi:MAG: serine/threonine protein kinase [Acidobacteria bacterium]|nr:serine/threonine protein kinase [Acidobacteriota bacterium]